MSRPEPTCPVCAAGCGDKPLFEYTVEHAAAHFCPPSRDRDRYERFIRCIRRLWDGDRAAVYRCPQCRFGFGWPHVGGDEEFYGLQHEMAAYPGWRWEYDLTIDCVLNQHASGGRILDIGTGSGNFLKALDAGWQRFATEGSETTRRQLRTDGITCFADTTDAVRQAAGTFDVITMFQVLEHIAQFKPMLADCHALLRSDGALVISVPSGDATFDQEQLTGCADMLPNHPNKWTPQSLGIALRAAGFDPRPALMQPGSVKLAAYRSFLRIKGRAARRPGSVASRVYSIRHRPMRVAVLGGLSLMSLIGHFPQWGRLSQGHSFAMVSRKAGAS